MGTWALGHGTWSWTWWNRERRSCEREDWNGEANLADDRLGGWISRGVGRFPGAAVHLPDCPQDGSRRYLPRDGVAIPDPYRWLEDDNSGETATWVEVENKVTFGYLNRIPYRLAMHDRVLDLNKYARYSAPSHRGSYFFFYKNDGLQNQSVLQGWCPLSRDAHHDRRS